MLVGKRIQLLPVSEIVLCGVVNPLPLVGSIVVDSLKGWAAVSVNQSHEPLELLRGPLVARLDEWFVHPANSTLSIMSLRWTRIQISYGRALKQSGTDRRCPFSTWLSCVCPCPLYSSRGTLVLARNRSAAVGFSGEAKTTEARIRIDATERNTMVGKIQQRALQNSLWVSSCRKP